MMGLLDSNDLTDDPRTQGLLSLGLRLLSSQGKFGPALGQAGLGAMGDLQAAQRDRDTRKRAGLQDQMLMMQMEQAKRQQEAQEAAQRQQAMDSSVMMRLAGMPTEGPRPDGMAGPGAPMPNAGIDPMAFLRQGGSMGGLPQVESINKSLSGPAPIKLEAGASLLAPGTYKPLATNPKEDTLTGDFKDYKQAVAQGYKGQFIDYQREMANLKAPKAPQMTVNVNPEKAFAAAIGPIAAKNIGDSQDQAVAAQGTLSLVDSVRSAVNSGTVLMGPGAAIRQSGMRVGQIVGAGTQGSADTLARTKQVEQGLAGLELEAAQLMKGQGQITESERKIIRKAAAGEIQDLSPKELDVALTAIERNAKRKIAMHASRISQMPASAAGQLTPLLSTTPQADAPAVRTYNPATGRIE
jgi:hypothetical protein